MNRIATALGGAVVALVVAACGDSSTAITGVSDATASLSISVEGAPTLSGPLTLSMGETAELSATAVNALGLAVADAPATWSSNAPTVAQVGSAGTVTALAAGSADIRASLNGVTATLRVTVTDTATTP